MLRPYTTTPTTTATTSQTPQSVPEFLRQQRIRVDLRLRNRHQHEMIRLGRLDLPWFRVLAERDQILASLRFKGELEQAFPLDRGRRSGAQRVPRWEGTSGPGPRKP